ncbi:PepSY domain-containing protein [Pantoea sp. 18069]|uniref:PepSY-associated TM helix domain-containing protein n=1 Tax=Pantoea sp. 18069 TaxID=2681415 RepID=UPI00135B7CEC|nr:PepSY-associated TM helix domain-containing protein [Pantoea sp. 18069]
MPRLRQLWLRTHRWAALGIGWILILSGLTGALLVAAQPLDRWLHPAFFKAPGHEAAGASVALEQVLLPLRAEFGPQTSFTLRPARESTDTLWVLVRGPWNGTVYFDPVSGREQGRRGETQGFVNTLFKLHSSLLLQGTGKAILAWVALVYLLLLVTGLILWWPRRWPPSWKVELGRGVLRALFDLHRVGGVVMGLVIAVSVASGAYMAWRPLGGAITWMSGATPVKPPSVPKASTPPGQPRTLDTLVAKAREQFPGTPVGYIQVPAQADRPVRIRLMLPDDPHPNGLTSVWLHPVTGDVLAVHRWNALDPGARAVAVIYPLHTGVLGGLWLELVFAVSGLILGMLGITGIWLWWRRRKARQA